MMYSKHILFPIIGFIVLSILFTFIIGIIIAVIEKYVNKIRVKKIKDEPFVKVECFNLSRSSNNPLLTPTEGSYWQSGGTFNPAVLIDELNHVHMLYRTIGEDGVSRLGYMKSPDGLSEWKSLAYPVFESDCLTYEKIYSGFPLFNPGEYTSGGGWVGCEDPRLCVIDDTVYMLYVAFAGWDSIRIAYTTQKLKDFTQGKFKWSPSRYLSPKGELHKNWVLFPEKINGKFALLYNIWPKICIHYVDRLEDLEHIPLPASKMWNRGSFCGMPDSWILIEKGTAGERWVDPTHLDTAVWSDNERWDTWMRGVGPTPLLIDEGWLVLYHAMDKNDPHRYKIGCMILDKNNPEKVLYKAPTPLLSPDMEYENDYKNGVLFACGAVIRKGVLFVYYGGGDKHVCVAEATLTDLLLWIKKYPVVQNISS